MKSRRTLTELAAAWEAHPHLGGRPGDDTILIGPDDGWGDLFRSRQPDCIPHLLRYGYMRPANSGWASRFADDDGYRITAYAECGNQYTWVEPLDPHGIMFVCRRCYDARVRWGGRTYNLIPDDGCSITDGKRRGRR